ncbi:hypothetical protein F5Y04DRAFT_263483 [Hypomontagnella monticulosa]|nr:hypothetical protein F5Y04DRAFT_263483 [Hypomontagnella monticulosa]
MHIPNLFSSTGDNMAMYDELYIQSWEDAINECEKKLERHDYERALLVKSLQEFGIELQKLLIEFPNEPSKKAINLIHPTLGHYETFAQNFVNMMANPVDTSMMWGLLFLVFKLALGSTGPVGPLNDITKWLEDIGRELQDSNDCHHKILDFEKVKRDTVTVNKEILSLWLNIITTFRNKGQGHELWLDKIAWATMKITYDSAYQSITGAVRHIEKIAKIGDRHSRNMDQISILHDFLSLRDLQQEVTIPCNTLPVAENRRFYGRQDILRRLEDHLKPGDINNPLSSVALCGLGGIGKTQIALAYGYQKIHQLDAVFWISAEDSLSIQQSFSRAALDALKLPKASHQAYQENMILVLNWLHKTSAKWLLIFDNVDNHDVLENCWPTSKHGAILVTTRDSLIATVPIDIGLDVNEFDQEEGAQFLLHLAIYRRRTNDELEAAQKIAKELGGLPLAINQMAALINARNFAMDEFQAIYAKYEQRLHKEKKNGWKYLGYQHALDTVWEISFANLSNQARACLGILSFFSADSVPIEVFTVIAPNKLPDVLSFCEDDLVFGEAIEELTHHALVKRNIQQGSFRVHRLVQAEYRTRMDDPQEEFEAAVTLLLGKIPSQSSTKFDNDEWIMYERYIPQVLSLAKHYRDSQTKPNPLKPNMDFVRLLTNSANAIHDNDTLNVVSELLETADCAYHRCSKDKQDVLLWALLQYLKCMFHFCTSEFARSETEMRECLQIRLELLAPDDLLVALSYNGLGMAAGTQGRYDEGLKWLLKAEKVYEGPAGRVLSRKLVWGYNIARNYYCMGRYEEAEQVLGKALEIADRLKSWYMQVYGHLTFASLRTRMNNLDDAKNHAEIAKQLLETSGTVARFSWLSSYCAYRAGDVALKQGRFDEAIKETENSTAIGKLVKVPASILARCVHAYSKALATDPSRQSESERQRMEARRLRASLPDGGGDLDDESDEAFEKLVKMDHR